MLTLTNMHTGDIHTWTHRAGLQLVFLHHRQEQSFSSKPSFKFSSAPALQGFRELLWIRSPHGMMRKAVGWRGFCVTKPSHKSPCHKISFNQKWSSVLKLVCFYLHFFFKRTNLVPHSSDGWKPQNFQPKYIHDPFMPICSCANAGLEFKSLFSLSTVNSAFIDSNHLTPCQIKAAPAAFLCSWSYFSTPSLNGCARTACYSRWGLFSPGSVMLNAGFHINNARHDFHGEYKLPWES